MVRHRILIPVCSGSSPATPIGRKFRNVHIPISTHVTITMGAMYRPTIKPRRYFMSKKQEMVNELIERLSVLNIDDNTATLGNLRLHAEDKFWERYPDGHCNSILEAPSVEGRLSCLAEESLQAILANDLIDPEISFSDLWGKWGRAGYFKCAPSIIKDRQGTPILRMRHDCYLHWFRGNGFQVSYDAYCNGSNGSSFMNFFTTRKAITLPECSSYRDEDDYTTDFDAMWNHEWSLFRKAMVVSSIAQACAGKSVFYQMVNEHSSVLDEFISMTDNRCMKIDVDSSLSWSDMYREASGARFSCPMELEVPVVTSRNNDKDVNVLGILRFGKSAVSFTWSEKGRLHSLCIEFPEWEREAWADEVSGGVERCMLDMRNYLLECWVNLGYTLITLAGIICERYVISPDKGKKFDSFPVAWWTRNECASNLTELYSCCFTKVKDYPDRKRLLSEI